MSFFARNLQIFKRIGFPLFVLTLAYTSIDQLLTLNMDEALKDMNGAMGRIWIYGFLSLIFGILFPILGILVVLYGAKTPDANEKGLFKFIAHHMNQMSIEILRSWGKTLLWSLLLLLPGLWKYMEYTFIPFIVTLSSGYQHGDVDALKASSTVFRKNLFKVLGILIFFHAILPSFLTVYFDDYRLVWHTPFAAIVLNFIDVYLFIFSTQLLLNVFENEKLVEAPHAEAHV